MVHHAKPEDTGKFKVGREVGVYVQLQQRPVGVAVAKFLLALLLHVALEGARRLGIVPLKTADNVPDIVRPLWGILARHFWAEYRGKFRGGWRERTLRFRRFVAGSKVSNDVCVPLNLDRFSQLLGGFRV